MDEVFISYARPTADAAAATAEDLRARGHSVWLDEALPAHGAFAEAIEERLRGAKAVLVLWSKAAAKSHWVRAEADLALSRGTLVQATLDGVLPPLPFNQFQCCDLSGAAGALAAPAWARVAESVRALVAGEADTLGGIESRRREPAARAGAASVRPSIAVLPFADLTGDPDQAYFADGMVEEIATALSRIKSIFVIAGASSRALRGANREPAEAARTLGVRYLLEGSVRKAGGRVRIAVGLVDIEAGARVWSERFEDSVEDVFAVQDRVALAVAGVIEPAIQTAEVQRALKRPAQDPGAYDLYLRALPLYQTLRGKDVAAALALLDEAIALDGMNAPALALAANCHAQALVAGWGSDRDHHRATGLDLAHRALQAAPDDPEVLARVATVYWHVGQDVKTATGLIDRSLALNPGSAHAWLTSGWLRLPAGDAGRAAEDLRTAMRLDPISPNRPMQLAGLALALFCQGSFAEAAEMASEAARLQPGNFTNHALLAACYGHLGRGDEARVALAGFGALGGTTGVRQWFRFLGDPEHRRLALKGLDLAESEAAGGS